MVVDEVSWLGVKGPGAFPALSRQWQLPGLAAHSCGGSAGLAQALCLKASPASLGSTSADTTTARAAATNPHKANFEVIYQSKA